MKTIIISPFSKPLRTNRENPKNYPYWGQVVKNLRLLGYRTVQIGTVGEPSIGADDTKFGLKLKDFKKLLDESNGFACVDNFFNHFATFYGKRGVVVFGRSDPKIFGYEQNINLLKDRACLRKNQFDIWEHDEFRADVFVSADEVVAAICKL